MDITIYLPDDIGKRAKASGKSLSRILRDKLEEMFEQEDAVEATLGSSETIELQLEDDEGRSYIGRINGTRIAESDSSEVLLTREGNVVLYDGDQLKYWVISDPEEELRDNLDEGAYRDAMAAIGVTPTVDLEI